MSDKEMHERVALAIGLAMWGSPVIPAGGWIKAAKAAQYAIEEVRNCDAEFYIEGLARENGH